MTQNALERILLGILEVFMAFVSLVPEIFKALVRNFGPRGFLKRKDVTNKVILITGGANGLGRLMALQFGALGARVVIWDIDEAGLDKVHGECKDLGASVHTYKVDMSDRKSIYATADKVKREVGDVDILINNAGIGRGGAFLDKDDDFIEKTVQINTIAHFWTAKSFLPKMIERNDGHIVCIASLAALIGAPTLAEYSASKFGAFGFQEAIENEVYSMGCKKIEFTTVCPTFVTTNMLKDIPIKKGSETLTPEYVVDQIVDAVLTNQRILCMPRKIYLLYAAKAQFPRKTLQKFIVSRT